MELRKRSQYALLAVVFMASQPKGKRSSSPVISKELNIPFFFLQMIMRQLGKADIITTAGRGGSILAKDPSQITLFEVVEAIEGSSLSSPCFSEAKSDKPCFIKLKEVCGQAIFESMKILKETTVADIVGESR